MLQTKRLLVQQDENKSTEIESSKLFLQKQRFVMKSSTIAYLCETNSKYFNSLKYQQENTAWSGVSKYKYFDHSLDCFNSYSFRYTDDAIEYSYDNKLPLTKAKVCNDDILQRNDNCLYQLSWWKTYMHLKVISCSKSKTMENLFAEYTPLSQVIYKDIILKQYLGTDHYHLNRNYLIDASKLKPYISCIDLDKLISYLFSHLFLLVLASYIMLIVKFYYYHIVYMIVCILFLIMSVLLLQLWAFTCKQNGDTSSIYPKCCFNLPVISVIACATTSDVDGCILTELSVAGFFVFPQYIIIMSYVLQFGEYDNYYILISAALSLFSLIITPTWSWFMFAEDYYCNKGLILSYCDKLKIRCTIIFTMLPILMIELIHFFPLLFAYYIDKSIEFDHVIIVLLLFNVPKLLFMIHEGRNNYFWSSGGCWGFILLIITYSCLPLIPYIMFFMKDPPEDRKPINVIKSTYYAIMMFYIWFSYVGMSFVLITIIGIDQLSMYIKCSIGILLIFVLWITFVFPKMYCIMDRLNCDWK